jgi:hypothetical protein
MSQRTFTAVASAIFLIVALGHASRLLLRWPVSLNGWDAPMWVSWAGLVVAGYLGVQGMRLARKA